MTLSLVIDIVRIPTKVLGCKLANLFAMKAGKSAALNSRLCENPGMQYLLTLGAHAQRGLQYLVCVSVCVSVCLCVCLCVCVSVTQHLTFYVFIRATNDTNLLSGG